VLVQRWVHAHVVGGAARGANLFLCNARLHGACTCVPSCMSWCNNPVWNDQVLMSTLRVYCSSSLVTSDQTEGRHLVDRQPGNATRSTVAAAWQSSKQIPYVPGNRAGVPLSVAACAYRGSGITNRGLAALPPTTSGEHRRLKMDAFQGAVRWASTTLLFWGHVRALEAPFEFIARQICVCMCGFGCGTHTWPALLAHSLLSGRCGS
jgi:hypothetical protein